MLTELAIFRFCRLGTRWLLVVMVDSQLVGLCARLGRFGMAPLPVIVLDLANAGVRASRLLVWPVRLYMDAGFRIFGAFLS